ncbi:hypothetical protein ACWGA9_06145 [Streptomyces sp. NPDC054950]
MSTPVEGEMTPVSDPVVTPVTEVTVDESGNTTVVGYPSGTSESYEGTPGTSAGGAGVGEIPDGYVG